MKLFTHQWQQGMLLALGCLLLAGMISLAASGRAEAQQAPSQTMLTDKPSKADKLSADEKAANKSGAVDEKAGDERGVILPYKHNFFLYSQDSTTRPDRKFVEVKFQLSFRNNIGNAFGIPFYFGYTQKSFWQLFDKDDSSPFRENNYNPEGFLVLWENQKFELQVGYEHESNGQPLPLSRSWNRGYLWSRYRMGRLQAELKYWQRDNEPAKSDPADPKGDDNPDIVDYLGHGEFYLRYRWDSQWLYLMARKGLKDPNGTWQLDYKVRLKLVFGWIRFIDFNDSSYLDLHYFNGYGESLADYNILMKKTGIGASIDF